MKKYILVASAFLLSITILLLLKKTDNTIVKESDYTTLLSEGNKPMGLSRIDKDLEFWTKRIAAMPDDLASQIKIAGLTGSRYQYSGNVDEVINAEKWYQKANLLQSKFGSGIYRSLAANCITRHQFRQAGVYIDSALAMGDDLRQTRLQQFDVSLELGNIVLARSILSELAKSKDFDFLIREAKFKDHAEGKLEEGILLMEKAITKIDSSVHAGVYCWAMANLGDMYSHAGKFTASYQCYTTVLKKDNHYYHALKGIAWLAFSQDKNTTAAKKILHYLKKVHPVPDYDLMLAQIAGYENNAKESAECTNNFLNEVKQPRYGDMYNKYIFYLQADELSNPDGALEIARTEVANRPTPESYNFLCWALYKKGDLQKAITVARTYVEDKCYEPDALYHLGVLYKATGNAAKARSYLESAASSSFELGPSYAGRINDELKKLL